MTLFPSLLIFLWCWTASVTCFSFQATTTATRRSTTTSISSSSATTRRPPLTLSFSASLPPQEQEEITDDRELQWALFQKHHALGSWKGVWTTFDAMGDVLDETIGSVNLVPGSTTGGDTVDAISHTHSIVVGAKRSDCATCFDSMETKEFPIATYTPDTLTRAKLGACGLVFGPSLLRGGVVATELVLRHQDARVRVTFQHAPVWLKSEDSDSAAMVGPPDGLKLFRCMISRETLRDTPPTAETEAAWVKANNNHADDDEQQTILFHRPVPPFDWHKDWQGTCWTWGPQRGHQGWELTELDESDAWHGTAPVEAWNLRLPGGVFVQAPRVCTPDQVGLCRLAWLPTSDLLVRLEAGISVLQPAVEDDEVVALGPPTLASLRCDVLQNMGELNVTPPSQWMQEENFSPKQQEPESPTIATQQQEEKQATVENATLERPPQPTPEKVDFNDQDLDDARDALQL